MAIIDPRVEEYVERLTSPHDALLAELSEETSALGSTEMLTGPVAGRFLEMLVWFGRPQRVLEIGTFSGHSALAMAAALPEDGRIDACELDPERAAFAQRYFDRSPHGAKITLHVGPALETIDRLEGAFDFVFIDADKEGYVDYYEAVAAAALRARPDRRRQHALERPRPRRRRPDRRVQRARRRRPAHGAGDPERPRRHHADPPSRCLTPRLPVRSP